MPELILFLDDWKKFPDATIQVNTANKSFLHYSSLLREMGVRNHTFALALLNPELAYIDPFDYKKLKDRDVEMIVTELKANPWYFFREIARSPPQTGPIAGPLLANRGNMAAYWYFFNHIIFFLILPRQNGKSYSIDTLNIYLMNFGCVGTSITMMTRSEDLRTKNLIRLKKIQEELPPYLDFRVKGDIFNTEEIRLHHPSINNNYKGILTGTSEKSAYNSGRGFSTPISHFDEPNFTPFIETALPVALASGNFARGQAKETGGYYGTMFTTTPGRLSDSGSKFIYDFVSASCYADEHLYDCANQEELTETILRHCKADSSGVRRPMMNLTYSYRQLGKSDEWALEQIQQNMGKHEDNDQSIFNRWTTGTQRNPLSPEQLQAVEDSKTEPVFTETIPGFVFRLNWYLTEQEIRAKEESGVSFIAGIDTSEGIGRDDIAIVVRDATDASVVAAGAFNELNLLVFGDYLCELLQKHPTMVMIIERQNSAPMMIDAMVLRLSALGISPFKRLFNVVVQHKEEHADLYKQIERYRRYDSDLYIKCKPLIGFRTSGSGFTSRNSLYSETFSLMAKYTSELVRDKRLADQLLGLVEVDGRIDHRNTGKDDMVIASLLSYWLIVRGTNLWFYGIKPNTLLKSNHKYIDEVYGDDYLDREEAVLIEKEITKLLEEFRELSATDDISSIRLEHRIQSLASEVKTGQTLNISVDQMLENIKSERRIRSRQLAKT